MKESVGIRGPGDGTPTPQAPDKGWSLAQSEVVKDVLSEKCARVAQLEKYCLDVRNQAIQEVEELKGIALKLGDEVSRLRKILKDNDIDYSLDFIESNIRQKME